MIWELADGKVAIDDLDLSQFCRQTTVPTLYLMKAGRLDQSYAERVRAFSWERSFRTRPTLFSELSAKLASKFDYVLIDSRTGVTDAGGVCTMLMPEKLVLVFTPNRQSLYGGIEITRRTTEYRLKSDDLRSYVVYPLPSRVDAGELELRRAWRAVYQEKFEALFRETYALDSCDLSCYFDEIQIPYVPRYAYGEDVAVLREESQDRFSLSRCYHVFKTWMTDRYPWEGPGVIDR